MDRVRACKTSILTELQPKKLKTHTAGFLGAREKIAAFLALPAEPGRRPAAILVHEWWGLNQWVKEQAVKLAMHGYIALAVDLYQGKVTSDPSEAREFKRGLQQGHAIGAFKAAFDYLLGRPDVDSKRICSVGWSMGGGLALELAIHEPQLAACVVHYGPLPTNVSDIQKISAPVLGLFGALDRGIPVSKARAFEKGMNAAGKQVEIEIYKGARHAFEGPSNERGYRPDAAVDTWSHMLKFLEKAVYHPPVTS